MNAKILKIIGNVLIALVILVTIPMIIPRLFGMSCYNVISGSMEPTISVGSIVYVKTENFNNLSEGDIIAFESGASIVTHRIASINTADMLITTKGDANATNDFTPVAYANVIGKVVAYFPLYGYIAAFFSESTGKIIAVILLILGVTLSSSSEKNLNDQTVSKTSRGINPKVVLAAGLIIALGAIGGFLYIFMDYQKSNNLYNEINASYVIIASDGAIDNSWSDMINIDFDALQQLNPDVIGWIYVEGTDISYPIMYSGDDEGYLHTTIDGEYAKAGSIFLEGYNLTDFSDSHSIIYGHNMRNLSMFGSLKFYKSKEDYLDEHRFFQIITPTSKMRFEIFSYFDTEPASWVYAVPYSDSAEFESYIGELLSHSYEKIDTSSDISSKNRIVTLSTCSANEMRFTIHGALWEIISAQN